MILWGMFTSFILSFSIRLASTISRRDYSASFEFQYYFTNIKADIICSALRFSLGICAICSRRFYMNSKVILSLLSGGAQVDCSYRAQLGLPLSRRGIKIIFLIEATLLIEFLVDFADWSPQSLNLYSSNK